MLDAAWRWLDEHLWGRRAHGHGVLAGALHAARYPYAMLRDLARGSINLHAMSLVFNTLLALIPLLAFSFAILKMFGAHRDLEPLVYEFFRPVGASAQELTRKVMEFTNKVSCSIVGSVGLVLLLWTLLGTLEKVELSFNYLWHVEEPRSLARRISEYLAIAVLGPMLLVLALAMGRTFGLTLAPYVLVTAIFTALYAVVPNTRVRLVPAMIGGLFAGALWAWIGSWFADWFVYSAGLTVVYAGFAFFVAGLLWVYVGWLILLLGARLTFYVQNPSYLRLGLLELQLSAAQTEDLALRIMYLVTLAYTSGATRWRTDALATELRVPGIAISHTTALLEAAGLLTTDERECWLPGRDPGHISLVAVMKAARSPLREVGDAQAALRIPAVDRLREELQLASDNVCGSRTLRGWVDAGAPRPIATRESLAGDGHPVDQQ